MTVEISTGTTTQNSCCWLLVVGCWLLVVGCWLLVVGCWLLVVGCWVKKFCRKRSLLIRLTLIQSLPNGYKTPVLLKKSLPTG